MSRLLGTFTGNLEGRSRRTGLTQFASLPEALARGDADAIDAEAAALVAAWAPAGWTIVAIAKPAPGSPA